jgi:hypothetical protein
MQARTRQSFFIRSLTVADLNVTVLLKDLQQKLEEATVAYEESQGSSYYYEQFLYFRQQVATLEIFKSLIEKALFSIKEKPALLPALTPLFLIVYGGLPIDPAIQTYLEDKFISLLCSDPYLAKRFESELFQFLVDEYEKGTFSCSASAYLAKEKKNFATRKAIFKNLFSELLFGQSLKLKQSVMDDASIFTRQGGQAFFYPFHRYTQLSGPVSKLQMKASLIESSKEPLKQLVLALVIPWAESQKGQTCKIHAFHAAAWVLHLICPETTPCPPPVHALPGMPLEKKSLVAQAQDLFSSKVGEVYSPAHLLSLIKHNGYSNIGVYLCEASNYIERLKSIIDRGGLALIYFDVSIDPKQTELYGRPCQQKGNYEHSAVVWGYSTTQSGKDSFYVYQWNSYYQFDAAELLASTMQLERRSGEVFYDLAEAGEPDWVDLRRITQYDTFLVEKINRKEYRNKLFAPPPPKTLPSFRNCIIALGPNLEANFKARTRIETKIEEESERSPLAKYGS